MSAWGTSLTSSGQQVELASLESLLEEPELRALAQVQQGVERQMGAALFLGVSDTEVPEFDEARGRAVGVRVDRTRRHRRPELGQKHAALVDLSPAKRLDPLEALGDRAERLVVETEGPLRLNQFQPVELPLDHGRCRHAAAFLRRAHVP